MYMELVKKILKYLSRIKKDLNIDEVAQMIILVIVIFGIISWSFWYYLVPR